jgi:di/tricarboxylate transporter
MNPELVVVLALLAATIIMFAINRPRMDVVALIMMTVLPLTGVIGMNEALAGFSDPNIILIAALFVVGEALVQTGVAQRLGDLLVRSAGSSETALIVMLMVFVAFMGSFMSSTGVVAIFIPIVLRIAANTHIAPARLMMPLSVAALISGMMTLVATAPNLVVNSQLARDGHEGFGFFAFTPFGVLVLVLAILYMLVARRWLGRSEAPSAPSNPRLADWVDTYGLAAREFRIQVGAGSAWVGQRLSELDLRATAGVNIVAIERGKRMRGRLLQPRADTELHTGDVLLLDVVSDQIDIDTLCRDFGLTRQPITGRHFADLAQHIGMVELLLPPDSSLAGRTIAEVRFRSTYGLTVLGIRRGGAPVEGRPSGEVLKTGDVLLAIGPWKAIRTIRHDRNIIVLELPAEFEEVIERPSRAPHAVAILALMIVLMVSGIVPNVQAAFIGCLLLGLFGCVDMTGAYRSVHWQSLVLIVGMLPFSLALANTGGVDLVASALLSFIGDAGPRAALAAIFTLTAVLSLFISNTATAVLMAPIALAVASDLGASPYPFAMTVALAASTAFMTPVSSPVNTLVIEPGNYSFFDFVKLGTPLAVITLVLCVMLVPLVFPF